MPKRVSHYDILWTKVISFFLCADLRTDKPIDAIKQPVCISTLQLATSRPYRLCVHLISGMNVEHICRNILQVHVTVCSLVSEIDA